MEHKNDENFMEKVNLIKTLVLEKLIELVDECFVDCEGRDRIIKMTAALNAIGSHLLFFSTQALTREAKKEVLQVAFKNIVKLIRDDEKKEKENA